MFISTIHSPNNQPSTRSIKDLRQKVYAGFVEEDAHKQHPPNTKPETDRISKRRKDSLAHQTVLTKSRFFNLEMNIIIT